MWKGGGGGGGGGGCGGGGISDPKDGISLAARQQTWWPETRTAEVKDFEQPVGPNHSLPVNAKPLDCFFLFLLSPYFTTWATDTNRCSQHKMAAKGVATRCGKKSRQTTEGEPVDPHHDETEHASSAT